MKKILIADDNKSIADLLSKYIINEGFQVLVASDGEEALLLFEKYKPDCILLDVMMPKLDGFSVCREIRLKSNVPIIMITARGEDFDRIMGLDIGADDYVVKPFSLREVMSRIHAIFRRMNFNEVASKVIVLPSLKIDAMDYTVRVQNNLVNLTKKEFELLITLAGHPNQVFTRDLLLEKCWGYDYLGDSRTVDAHIKRLRTKIDKYEHPEWAIKTIWGVGYKLEIIEHET